MIYWKLILVWLLAATLEGAAWQRHVLSGKGEFRDSPAPEPLAYFTRDPFMRDDGDQFCTACTPQDKATLHAQHKFKTELTKVGDLRGFAIYDLFYFFDDDIATRQIDWKSILVKVAPGRFREIYHLQPTQAIVRPSFLLKVGDRQILATRDQIPGTGNNFYEDYFWFDRDGPVRIDIDVIPKVLKAILPAGSGVWKGGGLHMKTLTYRMPVWKENDGNCCPTGGRVELKFRLDDGRLVVTGKHFDPHAKPE